MGAKCVEETGVHPKVVLFREIHEGYVQVFIEHQLITPHFEVSRLYFGGKPYKPEFL